MENKQIQLSLFDKKEKITEAKKILKEEKEISQGIYKCSLCGEKGKYGEEIFWFNGGGLYPSNFYAHIECYKNKLKKDYDFIDKGYIASNEKVRVFSQTTGWEDININDIEKLSGNIMGNPIFPYIVITPSHTFGITKECKECLEGKGIEYKKLEIGEIIPIP